MEDIESYADTMPDMFGLVFFCDDLRFENNGKVLAIGMYPGVMYVQGNFPFTLRSFAIFIQYAERIGTHTDDVKIQVLFPGLEVPFAEFDVPGNQLRAGPGTDALGGKANFHSAVVPVIGGPVVIPSTGIIRVIARVGSKVQRLGALTVAAAPAHLEQPKEAAN
jgi:hypothetical protein